MGIVMIGMGILIMGISLVLLVLRSLEVSGDSSAYVEPTTEWPREEVEPDKYIHPEITAIVDNRKGRVRAMTFLVLVAVGIIGWVVFQQATHVKLSFISDAVTKDRQYIVYSIEGAYEVWPPAFKERENISFQLRMEVRKMLEKSSTMLIRNDIAFRQLESPINFDPEDLDKDYKVTLVKLDISLREKGE